MRIKKKHDSLKVKKSPTYFRPFSKMIFIFGDRSIKTELMKPVKFKPYLQVGKTSQGGKSPIFISLSQYSDTSLISVGHSIPIAAWDKENCKVYERKPRISAKQEQSLSKEELTVLKKEYSTAIVLSNASTINTDIENRMFELNNLQNKLRVNNENLDIKTLKKIYIHNPDLNKRNDFIKFGDELADRFFKNGKIGTYKAYKTVVKKLSDYLENSSLPFQNMDVKFLWDYQAFMKKENLKKSSIHNNFKTIKAIYNQAIKEDLVSVEKNPFRAFKLERPGRSGKERLSVDELKSLENLQLDEGSLLWHVRNYFFFAFNTAGMRIGDLIFLKWEHINDGRIDYTMFKTGKEKSLGLSKKNIEILKYYYNDNVKPSHYVFPLLKNDIENEDALFLYNQKSSKTTIVNSALKDLAKLAGIKKNLSTHIARHSFADIARKKNVSLFDLKNLLAHDSVKTTEMYLASLDIESQDETLNKVLELNE